MRSISRACRRGDQVGAFAAVHESESGTFETCPRYLKMSSSRGRPEVISARPERRDWTPKKDIAAELTREGRRWVHDPALRLPRDEMSLKPRFRLGNPVQPQSVRRRGGHIDLDQQFRSRESPHHKRGYGRRRRRCPTLTPKFTERRQVGRSGQVEDKLDDISLLHGCRG